MRKLGYLHRLAAHLMLLDGHPARITIAGNCKPACEGYDGAHESKHKAQQHQILQPTAVSLLQLF